MPPNPLLISKPQVIVSWLRVQSSHSTAVYSSPSIRNLSKVVIAAFGELVYLFNIQIERDTSLIDLIGVNRQLLPLCQSYWDFQILFQTLHVSIRTLRIGFTESSDLNIELNHQVSNWSVCSLTLSELSLSLSGPWVTHRRTSSIKVISIHQRCHTPSKQLALFRK